MPQLGIAIIVVIIVNGAFSLHRSTVPREPSVRRRPFAQDRSRAARGRKLTVSASQLVPGDIVLLREGDRISADARVLRSSELKVDMSTLTGESKPIGRVAEPLSDAPVDPFDAPNVVFAGTFVTSGSGTGRGRHRRRHPVGRDLSAHRRCGPSPTPLRFELNRVVRVIAGVAVATGLCSSGLRGSRHSGRDGFLFSVGVIVALVPEGLLPTLSLSLAMSATRMAHRGALVRRLESVETLGCTTVICTDKTGTITTNQMTVKARGRSASRWSSHGLWYDPAGTILTSDGRPL